MTDWGPPYGFSSRKLGSCARGEEVCVSTFNLTATSGSFYRCCPGLSYCGPAHQGICCPKEGSKCTKEISNPAHCADESWDLFRNPDDDSHFCCEQGKIGFIRPGKGVGWAEKEDITDTDRALSAVNSRGKSQTFISQSIGTSLVLMTLRRCPNIE
jgi:hypothetical protein